MGVCAGMEGKMAMTSSLIEGDGFANVSVHTLNLMGNLLYPSFGAFINSHNRDSIYCTAECLFVHNINGRACTHIDVLLVVGSYCWSHRRTSFAR